jgi:antitoxin MazE
MKTTLIRIGNSQGVRIPKPFIEQCGFRHDVELDIRGHELVIHAHYKPRTGWESAFQQMAQRGDDHLVDDALTGQTSWDDAEWEWK